MLMSFREFKADQLRFENRRVLTAEENEELKAIVKGHKKRSWRCIWQTIALIAVAIVANIMQVLAILAFQHCHNEALLGLYWPLWTLLGLGSTIAMFGVVINQIYALRGHEPPPFATALGTPVLVVCAAGYFLYSEYVEWRDGKK